MRATGGHLPPFISISSVPAPYFDWLIIELEDLKKEGSYGDVGAHA